jgi:hypothetical protein
MNDPIKELNDLIDTVAGYKKLAETYRDIAREALEEAKLWKDRYEELKGKSHV